MVDLRPTTPSCPPPVPRPALTMADILQAHGDAFLRQHAGVLSAVQRRALRELAVCRTAALGGHRQRCLGCGHERLAYNSCRNRHCPTCQATSRASWLAREASHLLPVEYHHVVFTLPAEVAAVALASPAVVYGLLFQAAQEAIREVAANPRYLGAEVGVLAVLHTWGQNLHHHPHVHCVASGGGLSCDRRGRVDAAPRWVSCRRGFFVPVRVLSRVYRGKFLSLLRQAYDGGRLLLHGGLAWLAEGPAFAGWLKAQGGKDWVVYSQPPCAGPEVVLKYLARYVHRVAISNGRLRSLSEGRVTFVWKDYAHGGKERVQSLEVAEFLRRFVQHVLPRGFVRVRHYGLLASRGREAKLSLCRRQLALTGVRAASESLPPASGGPWEGVLPCPGCGGLQWVVVGKVERASGAWGGKGDTS